MDRSTRRELGSLLNCKMSILPSITLLSELEISAYLEMVQKPSVTIRYVLLGCLIFLKIKSDWVQGFGEIRVIVIHQFFRSQCSS